VSVSLGQPTVTSLP